MTKAERTRQFIIEQSAPLFNTKGLAGTAMSDVMEATKMAKGGLYGHFESKEALANAVVEFNLGKLVEKAGNAVSKANNAKDKLFAFLDVFGTPMQTPVEGGCPILNFGTEADDTNPVVRNLVSGTILSAQKRISSIVELGIANREFKSTFDPREFSIKVMTLIEGGTLIGRVLQTNDQMKIMIDMLKNEINGQEL